MTPQDDNDRDAPPGHDDWLEAALDDLGAQSPPAVSDDLMARVLADGLAHMPPPDGRALPRPGPPWARVVQGLGGWRAVGGLVAAAATGFVVGLGGIDMGAGGDALAVFGYEAVYDGSGALDAFGWDLEEG